jgi:hypothetical protein
VEAVGPFPGPQAQPVRLSREVRVTTTVPG